MDATTITLPGVPRAQALETAAPRLQLIWQTRFLLFPAFISGLAALGFTAFVWSTAHFYESPHSIYPRLSPPPEINTYVPSAPPMRVARPAAPAPKPLSLRERQRRYWPLVRRHSRRFGIDPALVMAVIQVESRFNPVAVSPKGATGLMQIVPITAEHLGLSDPLDPEANLEAGIRYLAELKKTFPNDLSLVLAAYNAGPTKVMEVGGVPDQKETRQYLQRVLEKVPSFRARFQGGLQG